MRRSPSQNAVRGVRLHRVVVQRPASCRSRRPGPRRRRTPRRRRRRAVSVDVGRVDRPPARTARGGRPQDDVVRLRVVLDRDSRGGLARRLEGLGHDQRDDLAAVGDRGATGARRSSGRRGCSRGALPWVRTASTPGSRERAAGVDQVTRPRAIVACTAQRVGDVLDAGARRRTARPGDLVARLDARSSGAPIAGVAVGSPPAPVSVAHETCARAAP